MKKKLIIGKCNECKHVAKLHRWRHDNDSVYYVKVWSCLREGKEIDTDEILYNFEKFPETGPKRDILLDIPEWCQLENV